jgi:dimethylargininase
MRFALTREVSPSIVRCELTHLVRETIDVDTACAQHEAYERCLASLGCDVRRVPPEPLLPDAVFVEDTAVVLDEVAIVTRPGAPSRRGEAASVAAALGGYRELRVMRGPGTLDGGDVLRIGRRLLVGLSARSGHGGIEELGLLVAPLGYTVEAVPLRGCLHLKSAATLVAPDTVLINPAWVAARDLGRVRTIAVDAHEPAAANALLVGGTVVHPASFARTRERLESHGIAVRSVDVSELAKAEGGVTCCSLVFDA